MESEHFAELDELGAGYWWFATRFEVVWRLATRGAGGVPHSIVDLGCGTGSFLAWLMAAKGLPRTRLVGLEAEEAGLTAAARRGVDARRHDLMRGDLAATLTDMPDACFMLDVLEHLESPVQVLRAACAAARPDAVLVVTVPALPLLWSDWDERVGHHRRYTRSTLRDELQAAGWQPVSIQYLFFSMVLPGLLRRLSSGASRRSGRGFPPVPRAANAFLKAWSLAEARLGRWLPAGTSLAALACKPSPAAEPAYPDGLPRARHFSPDDGCRT